MPHQEWDPDPRAGPMAFGSGPGCGQRLTHRTQRKALNAPPHPDSQGAEALLQPHVAFTRALGVTGVDGCAPTCAHGHKFPASSSAPARPPPRALQASWSQGPAASAGGTNTREHMALALQTLKAPGAHTTAVTHLPTGPEAGRARLESPSPAAGRSA